MAVRKVVATCGDATTSAEEGEVWKPIPGHEGYEVSDQGRVRSLSRVIRVQYAKGFSQERRLPGRMLKPKWVVGSKYDLVTLTRQKPCYVHHLVLLAFVGPCPRGKVVRHLDGDPHNNNLENLRYGTRRENWDDAVRHGTARRGEKNHNAILTEQAAREIKDSKRVDHKTLARKYGVALATVNNIRTGRGWKWLDG